jgi:hypothetical protein
LEAQKRWQTVEENLKLFFGKSKAARPVDVVNQGIKTGVAVQRYRISREDGKRIQKLEHKNPELALADVLRILRGTKS